MSVNCSDGKPLICFCSESPVGRTFFSARFVSCILLVPLFLSVLILGFRKWKNRRSSVRHSDVLIFHMVAMEMLSAPGSVFFSWGLKDKDNTVFMLGVCLCIWASDGQLVFHSLTCVERYLAVVYPIVYLRLKERGGVIVRNIGVGFAWGFSVCNSLAIFHSVHTASLVFFTLVVSSLALTSFCSVSVLCVLIRPGPGEGGGTRKQLNQSKLSAFYTIVAILAVLALKLGFCVVYETLFLLNISLDDCLMFSLILWLGLPSSLVLPLLFLYRETTTGR